MPSDQSASTHDKKTQIILIGADGRLGGVLLGELVTGGYQVTGLTLSDLDITDAERVAVTLERLRPEADRAAISQEMVERGDWIVPRFLGRAFLDKPILFFWAQAASIRAFGMNTAAARLPGMLFALLGGPAAAV